MFAPAAFLGCCWTAIPTALCPTFCKICATTPPSPPLSGRGCDVKCTEADIHFEQVAVSEQQAKQYQLPTRPTKKTDSRSMTFQGRSVELDSIRPALLKGVVQDRIVQPVDHDELERLQDVERAERDTLSKVASAGFARLRDFTGMIAGVHDKTK
jgi:hypothetical protein